VIARRYLVTGRVQGVGYRDWTAHRARALELTGWVRNRSDGSVEIVAHGNQDALDRLAQSLVQGPPAAQVRSVRSEDAQAPEAGEFFVRPTL